MLPFQFSRTTICDLILIKPPKAGDQRGSMIKAFENEAFAEHGIHLAPAEELESTSCRHTLRGLHFQHRNSQDKLIRVLAGEVYDVAVDLRPDSETFGKWQGFCLSAENSQMLYIPKRFAHGFLVLSSEAVLHYLCGDRYDPDSEDGIIWNDPDLAIDWPLEPGCVPVLSLRDQKFASFADFCASIGM